MPELGEIITNLKQDLPALVKDNIALAQSEMKPAAKHAGIGGGMFGGAGYLALHAVSMLVIAGGFGFSLMYASLLGWGPLLSAAVGFASMAVLLLIIVAVLALLGKAQIGKIKKPEATIEEAKATQQAIVAALKRNPSPAITGPVIDSAASGQRPSL
jgi:hypothetical protein